MFKKSIKPYWNVTHLSENNLEINKRKSVDFKLTSGKEYKYPQFVNNITEFLWEERGEESLIDGEILLSEELWCPLLEVRE